MLYHLTNWCSSMFEMDGALYAKPLDCDVPKNIAFPQVNERAAMESFAKEQVRRGLVRWAMIFILIVANITIWRFWLK